MQRLNLYKADRSSGALAASAGGRKAQQSQVHGSESRKLIQADTSSIKFKNERVARLV